MFPPQLGNPARSPSMTPAEALIRIHETLENLQTQAGVDPAMAARLGEIRSYCITLREGLFDQANALAQAEDGLVQMQAAHQMELAQLHEAQSDSTRALQVRLRQLTQGADRSLSEVETRIVAYVALGQRPTTQEISQHVGVSDVAGEHYVLRLYREKMIDKYRETFNPLRRGEPEEDSHWICLTSGLDYLETKGLLK